MTHANCGIGFKGPICLPSNLLQTIANKIGDKLTDARAPMTVCEEHGRYTEINNNLYTDKMVKIAPPNPVISDKPLPVDDKLLLFERIAAATNISCQQCIVKYAKIHGLINDKEEVQIIEHNFAPVGPNEPEWLSNYDLDKILQQYVTMMSQTNTKFYPYRFNMSDMAKNPLSGECELLTNPPHKINEKNKDIVYFGAIINTSKLGQRGQHWVCIFVDISGETECTIEFFNSFAHQYDEINKVIAELCIGMSNYLRSIDDNKRDCKIIMNCKINHQKTNYQCGGYCLYYIYQRLMGNSYQMFNEVVPDAVITNFKERIFSPSIP